jgi:acetate kinase
MLVLALTCDRSSTRFQLRQIPDDDGDDDGPKVLAAGEIGSEDGLPGLDGSADGTRAMGQISRRVHEALGEAALDAVGHKVVHGGERFTAPTVVTDDVLEALEQPTRLAPEHNHSALQGIRISRDLWPGIPQVAVFDSAFHRTLPEVAWRYPIPDGFHRRQGIRRYGFHGISVEFAARIAAGFLGMRIERFDGIVAHLDHESSVTALKRGRSIDTSMGLTPADGLVMDTSCGDLDPSVLLHLQRRGLEDGSLEELLNRHSGFQALCGLDDLGFIQEVAANGGREARLALEIAAYRLAKYIGGYHVAVGGAQALVFTGHYGQDVPGFRALVVNRLAALGVVLDGTSNLATSREPRLISAPASAFPVLVVPADQERAVAEATAGLLRRSKAGLPAVNPTAWSPAGGARPATAVPRRR